MPLCGNCVPAGIKTTFKVCATIGLAVTVGWALVPPEAAFASGQPQAVETQALTVTSPVTLPAGHGLPVAMTADPTTTGHYLACALSNHSFLGVATFGNFFVDVSQTSYVSTWTGILWPGVKPPLWDTLFRRSRLIGEMSRRALEPPFIEQEDAEKARTAHIPTPWPLSPLSGLVVLRTPGLLEVYQTHNVYAGGSGPYSLSRALLTTGGGLGGFASVRVKSPSLPTGTISYEFLEVPPKPSEERIVLVGVVDGPVLAQFAFEGGAAMNGPLVATLVRAGASRLVEACRR